MLSLILIVVLSMPPNSLASSPHPSVSGLVMTVCACVDFPRKTWEFGYHRLLARLLSATVRLVGKAGITFKRRADTRDTQRIRWQRHFSQVFLGKSTHAQTVITRPLTEGCELEARLASKLLPPQPTLNTHRDRCTQISQKVL